MILPRNGAQLFAAALLSTACGTASREPTFDEVRAVAEKYRDVNVAKAEGFTTDNKCVTAEMLGHPAAMGAMGLHYVRRDLLGLPPASSAKGARVRGSGTHTDFRQPAMLVYEPQADGSLQLVAVENLVFKDAWHAKTAAPPTFHGRTYPLLEDNNATPLDEAHGWKPHYEQHLWVFRDNPNGIYSPFNPNVTCRHHQAAAAARASKAGA
ncbi:MAG: hypothetical protein ABIS39_04460 [Sphingomicrobium sp.]